MYGREEISFIIASPRGSVEFSYLQKLCHSKLMHCVMELAGLYLSIICWIIMYGIYITETRFVFHCINFRKIQEKLIFTPR